MRDIKILYYAQSTKLDELIVEENGIHTCINSGEF